MSSSTPPPSSGTPGPLDDLGQRILESIPLDLITVDQDLDILHVNRSAARLLDRSSREAVGAPLADAVRSRALLTSLLELVSEDLDPPRTRALDDIPILDQPRSLHVTASRKEGTEHTIFVIEDVTERKRAEAAEVRYQGLLIKNERLTSLAGLISGVAHELNNPLSIIVGYADLVQRGIPTPGLMEKALEAMNKAATRCRKTVKGLLKLARENQPERKEVAVEKILQEAIDLVAYPLRVADITLTTRFDPIPKTMADGHQLLQVFFNLLNNAYQALQPQTGAKELEVSCWEEDGLVRVRIADTGPGIPPEHLETIFQPFFTTKAEGVGTGLGLPIAYGILREHGGTLRVTSERGQGTVFTVELPVGTTEVVEADPDETLEDMSLAGRRVLVVDDEEGILDFCAAYFTDLEAEFDVCCDGAQAIERIGQHDYDLILLDIRMPGLTGRDLFIRLKQLQPVLGDRVVFMTGDTADPKTLEFLKESNRPYVFKPFTLPKLEQILVEQFGTRSDDASTG